MILNTYGLLKQFVCFRERQKRAFSSLFIDAIKACSLLNEKSSVFVDARRSISTFEWWRSGSDRLYIPGAGITSPGAATVASLPRCATIVLIGISCECLVVYILPFARDNESSKYSGISTLKLLDPF